MQELPLEQEDLLRLELYEDLRLEQDDLRLLYDLELLLDLLEWLLEWLLECLLEWFLERLRREVVLTFTITLSRGCSTTVLTI